MFWVFKQSFLTWVCSIIAFINLFWLQQACQLEPSLFIASVTIVVWNNNSISALFLLLYSPPILYLTDSKILLDIFLSNIKNVFLSDFLIGNDPAPYRITGRISIVYNCFFSSDPIQNKY